MYGRKVKLRFFFISLIFITLVLSVYLILRSLEENVIYFQSPSEIKDFVEVEKKKNNSRRNGKKKFNLNEYR